jgi:hypothetical protein
MILPQLVLLLASASSAPDSIVRLKPSDFPALPANIVRDLNRRGCTIPQSPIRSSRHNVISGQFAKPGQTDWAVLCSKNSVSSILLYWGGSEVSPASINASEDKYTLQSDETGKLIYSRAITTVGKPYILEHYKRYGGPKPPPIDHDGIDDAFLWKASVVSYLYAGKWLRLTGAD